MAPCVWGARRFNGYSSRVVTSTDATTFETSPYRPQHRLYTTTPSLLQSTLRENMSEAMTFIPAFAATSALGSAVKFSTQLIFAGILVIIIPPIDPPNSYLNLANHHSG